MPETEEPEALFSANRGLVTYVLCRISRLYTWLPIEDLRQQGYLGLVWAARQYDPARGAAFPSYAVPCIRGYMLRLVSGEDYGRWPRNTVLTDEEDLLTAVEEHKAEDLEPEVERDIELIRMAVEDLRPPGREVVRRYFGFGGEPEGLASIARSLGVSRQRAWQIGQQALCAIRRAVKRARWKETEPTA